jgi:hypothetical protein
MIVRKLAMLGAAVAMVGTLAFALPATAGAAPTTGYPGTTTTPTTTGGGTILGCGGTLTISIGNTVVVTLTGCSPNATYTISIDGVATGITVTSDASGKITLTISVSDPHISVNGSSLVSAVFGTNPVVLTSTTGLPPVTVNVVIPSAATTAGTSSSGSSGSLAFTGADIAATVVGGLALLAVGTLLVVFTRRRAGHQNA